LYRFDLAAFAAAGGVGTSRGDFALFVYYLSFVSSFELWRIHGAVQADGGLFERMATLLQGTRQKLWLLTTLYLNDLRGQNQKLPPVDQPRWDENDCTS